MRKKIKWASIVAISIVIILLLLYVTFEYVVLPTIARLAVGTLTDLDVRTGRIVLDPFKHRITISGTKILNPKGFKDRVLAFVPLLVMDFKKKTFQEKGAFLDKIVIHIEEFTIVRDEDNIVNLSKIKALTPLEEPKENGLFAVDSCLIEIEKVRYVDYTQDENGQEKIFEINDSEEYKKIRDPDRIGRLIAFKIFFSGKLDNIGVDIQKIQKDLAQLAQENEKLAQELEKLKTEKDQEVKKGIEENIEDIKEKIDKIEGNNKPAEK
jgi:hypothetical protein